MSTSARIVATLGAAARDGLPLSSAVALGAAPREGTGVPSLPSVPPPSTVPADHRTGDDSHSISPGCS